MNILFLMGKYPGIGGVEVVSTVLANEFIREGFGVSLVSFEQPTNEKVPIPLSEKVKFYPLQKPVSSATNVTKLHTILVGDHIDILINQWVVPYYVARLCSRAMKGTKCKMIGVHHNLPNSNFQIEQVRIDLRNHTGCRLVNYLRLFLVTLASRLSLRYTISQCAKYITLSPSFISIAQRFTWKSNDSERFCTIANPLTIATYDGEHICKKNEIIYVGRIEYNQKCTYRIVDIWEKLENQYPNWCLKIVGDGPDRDDLQGRIHKKGMKNITIEGFQKPNAYYKDAKLLLMTSAYEGFPLIIAEGMEYGVVPLVFDSFPTVHDIIDDGLNGFIIPQPYSDDAFVAKMDLLMQNEKLFVNMSESAMLKAKDFSLEQIVGKWKRLLLDVINNK